MALDLSIEETAQRIGKHCGVSALRAWRLASNMTLQDLAKRIRQHAKETGEPTPLISHQRISAWERGEDVPSPRYLDALCRAFGTRPDRLGFGTDYGHAAASTANQADVDRSGENRQNVRTGEELHVKRRNLLRGAAGLGLGAGALDQVADTRIRVSDLFGTSGLSREALERWEETAEQHGLDYRATPAHLHLLQVTEDFEQIGACLAAPQGLRSRYRLHRVAAQLAAVAGVLLIDLEQGQEARAWFRTAALAAAETGDRPLQSWIRSRESLCAFYYSSPQTALRLAGSAAALADGLDGAAPAMALAVLARARALAGDQVGAVQALRAARERHGRATRSEAGLYGFAERKLSFYEGEVLARAGDTRSAMAAQETALQLYGRSERIDPALVRVARAQTLLRSGEIDEGMNVLLRTMLPLTSQELHGTVLAAVQATASSVPERCIERRSVREIREFLAEVSPSP
ncbi:helix-turn-helix transcriptional regulator [Streptomyces sp. B6B3]|uniref:helix-turn-helix domain-containing protein n=1 Tax=Streptomyces sp. B6B3 TaxID=3153570 RepID=UPI00325EB6AF